MENGSDIHFPLNFSHRLFADQVRKQFEQTASGTAATLVNSTILAIILKSHVSPAVLLTWLACAVLVSISRLMLLWFYRRSGTQDSEPEKWNALFIGTLFLAGLFWGSAAVFLFPEGSFGHQVLIAFVTGGMVAGAVSSFTAVIAAFFFFAIPALLPICIRFFLAGSDIHVAMGSMVALYLLILSMTSARMHKDIVHLLALKYERSALIADLQQEIRQRRQAQENLRIQKARVEAIVDQRTAELRKSEEKYRELVENINDVIYAVNRDGVVTYVSPVVESVFGFGSAELIGKTFLDFIHPRDRQRAQRDFERTLKVASGPREYRFVDKAGQIRWCRANSRPAFESGEKSGIQGVLVDITQSKRLEEQLQRAQKMEALGTLAGGVAHDLNNILSGIVSYPELMLMDLPEDSRLRKPLTTIKTSGENAAAIVRDLLTLAGRGGAPAMEVLCLNEIVRRCLDAPEIQALNQRHPNIVLAADLQPDLLRIRGSAIHVFKSLSNLVFNAVEAIPRDGRIEIATANRYADLTVSGFDTAGEGEYVVLSVADTGIGIPESERSRIFEPFYSRKINGSRGSGLGMAVVWGMVKDHNGYIDLQSQEGRGTRIELYFPAIRDPIEEIRSSEKPEDYSGNGQFILVVDDIPLQREIAAGILERLGYRTLAVGSGEEAVDFLRRNTADLVIVDMIMPPGIDGLETYRRILDLHPSQKAVIASGYSETGRVREALGMGATRYIRKPYTLTSIAKVVREMVQAG
jgi:two-component system cell cycle sensor histidine kinase/response regulator CckA